jgi:hypothetical protein
MRVRVPVAVRARTSADSWKCAAEIPLGGEYDDLHGAPIEARA